MDKPLEHYWAKRLADLQQTLEGQQFEVYAAADPAAAHRIVMDEIFQMRRPQRRLGRLNDGGRHGLFQASRAAPTSR